MEQFSRHWWLGLPALQKAPHELQPRAAAPAPSGMGSSHQLLPLEVGEPLENIVCVHGGISYIHQEVYQITDISLLSLQAYRRDLLFARISE